MEYSLRDVSNELRQALKQTLDDADVSLIQVAYWVTTIGDRLKSQHIAKRDSGKFLSIFPDVPVLTSSDNNTKNVIKSRKYINLPLDVYSMDKDKGINYISFYNPDENCLPELAVLTFSRTSQNELNLIYNASKHEKPSVENPYFYVAGNVVYFAGIEQTNVNTVEVGLFGTFPKVSDIDVDVSFEFPQELFSILHRQVLDLGRFVLIIPKERVNDGDNQVENVPTNKISSVNDLNPGDV